MERLEGPALRLGSRTRTPLRAATAATATAAGRPGILGGPGLAILGGRREIGSDDGGSVLSHNAEVYSLWQDRAMSGSERYELSWVGKAAALESADSPLSRSIVWSSGSPPLAGEHIFFSGDNLDGLKALHPSMGGEVGLIYIDPPYNTGQKFTYEDRFGDHSRWLSMMAPRLKLAREFLRDDGLLFVSIDEHEHRNLVMLGCEVFGEEHYLGDLIWKKKSGGASDASSFIIDHEYIVCFRKTDAARFFIDPEATVTTSYPHEDDRGRYSLERLDKQNLGYEVGLDFPIEGPNGRVYRVHHKDPNNKRARWRWSTKSVRERYGELVFRGDFVYTKNYAKVGARPRSLLVDRRFGRTRTGKHDLQRLFGATMLDYPKPTRLLRHLLRIASPPDALVMDFFAGSGTTGHAVLESNSEEGASRRFLLMQLDEPLPEDSDAEKMGLKTIAELAIERLHRACAALPEARADEERRVAQCRLG